ncbi:phage minor head protein [Pseudomonas aeruginosa]|uniref:phage head morphogenesis protein n=1 Tax=Pseudomonas aeruginosa TaxID=287 RepID=UPI001495E7E3|nr:phage minor head protein [Pseudomonas aeruginosa]
MAVSTVYGSLPFQEQIRFLQAKHPSIDYNAVRGAANDQSFVSAGANRADLVADLHAIIVQATRDGMTLAEFRKDYDAVLDHYEWEPEGGRAWRARVIYETNLRTSYAAGRYAQLQAVKGERPFWMYNHSDAVEHPRELHLAWDGLVIHADNPWWRTHYPPNGWGCQCSVSAYAEDELASLGKDGPDAPPSSRMRRLTYRGEVVEVPEGIDPGWDYAPGRSNFEQLVQGALQKTTPLPPEPAAKLNQQLLQNRSVATAVQADWERWLDTVANDPVRRGRRVHVGTLSPQTVEGMSAAGVEARTAIISVGDSDILHVLRDAKAMATTAAGLPKALSLAELATLPQILAQPQAVLLDAKSNTLIYAFAAQRREAGKIAVLVNFQLKGGEATNSVRSGSLIDWADVAKDVKAGKLVVLEGAL